jgi:hypothetical protein
MIASEERKYIKCENNKNGRACPIFWGEKALL